MTSPLDYPAHPIGYFEVRDRHTGRVRLQSLREIDAAEYARKLIAAGESAPEIFFCERAAE